MIYILKISKIILIVIFLTGVHFIGKAQQIINGNELQTKDSLENNSIDKSDSNGKDFEKVKIDFSSDIIKEKIKNINNRQYKMKVIAPDKKMDISNQRKKIIRKYDGSKNP